MCCKRYILDSTGLRVIQSIAFWTLLRHIRQQRLFLREYQGQVGVGALATHRVGRDPDYAVCGAAVYELDEDSTVTCQFCRVLAR